MGNITFIAWIQVKNICERVHKYNLFQTLPDHITIPSPVLRNYFFERRKCSFCGAGSILALCCSLVVELVILGCHRVLRKSQYLPALHLYIAAVKEVITVLH